LPSFDKFVLKLRRNYVPGCVAKKARDKEPVLEILVDTCGRYWKNDLRVEGILC